jgi:ATP-binding cassette subfamily B protein
VKTEDREDRQIGRRIRFSLRVVGLIWAVSPARVAVILLLTVAVGLVPAYQVHLTAAAVQAVADAIVAGGSEDAVDRAFRSGLMLAAVTAGSTIVGVIQNYVSSILQIRLGNSMAEKILLKATALDLRHYENDKYYDSLQRASREAGSRPYAVFTDLIGLGGNVIGLLSMLGVLFTWDVRLGLFLLLSPLPSLVANLVFGRKGFEIEHKRAAERRKVAYLQSLVTSDKAFKEIRLLQLEPLLLGRFRAAIQSFFVVDRSLIRKQTLVNLPLSMIGIGVAAGSMLYAMQATISIGLIGQFSAFVQAVGRVQTSAQLLVSGISRFYSNTLFLGNLFEFLDLPQSTIKGGSLPFPERLRYGIEFRDVSFVYPGTTRVALNRLTCVLPAGKCAAVVGANGAGKTTLVKLLTRLYEPTSGQILVDGLPIEEYDLHSLRRNIGVIFQDFVHYEMTVRENIGFGSVGHMNDRERVRLAAEQSRAAPFLEKLPQGYDTMLGRLFEGGQQLSGGQWQKVALARAFMRQAPMVILDEPTASIDAEAEAEIFGRLREIARDATSLLIAHRFSTVRMADHIIVLDDGTAIEQGSHDELLLAEGTYARLFMLQATGYLEGVEEAEQADTARGRRGRHADGSDGRVDAGASRRTVAGRAVNGHAVNGHAVNGHAVNGHAVNVERLRDDDRRDQGPRARHYGPRVRDRGYGIDHDEPGFGPAPSPRDDWRDAWYDLPNRARSGDGHDTPRRRRGRYQNAWDDPSYQDPR